MKSTRPQYLLWEAKIARRPRKKRSRLFVAKDTAPPKRITIKLSKDAWVNSTKDKKMLRDKLIIDQDGLCPILEEPMDSPCLDHDHFDGRVRGVIGTKINMFEGSVTKLWQKLISDHTETTLSTALRNLADYLEQDNSDKPLHGSIVEDQKKFLRRLTKETIVRRGLSDLDLVIPDDIDKSEQIRLYLETFVEHLEENRNLWNQTISR